MTGSDFHELSIGEDVAYRLALLRLCRFAANKAQMPNTFTRHLLCFPSFAHTAAADTLMFVFPRFNAPAPLPVPGNTVSVVPR